MTERVDTLVSLGELATLLGIDARTVATYKSQGMPGAITRGKYSAQKSIEWKINREVQLAVKSHTPSAMSADDAKARKLAAEAQLSELELATAREEMVNISDARKEVERYLSIVRSALLSFPARFAPFAVMLPDEKAARLMIEEHIGTMMTDVVNQTDAPIEAEEEEEEDEEDDE